jgi:hypothetical protein
MTCKPFAAAGPLLFLGLSLMHGNPCAAEDSLKVIDPPGGGHLVFGPVKANSPGAAMGIMLRTVHRQFGRAPTVGKVFESRDGRTFGAFFTLIPGTSKDTIAGLVVVAVSPGAGIDPAAAVLYDHATRFAKTEPVLMQALTDGWKKSSAASPAPSAANAASNSPRLEPTRFPDGSGAVSLPEGWRVTFASHGSARIMGPRGESVLLSNTLGPIYDPADPRVQSRLRYANPRAKTLLCPSGDALHTYQCVLRLNNPQSSLEVTRSQPLAPRGAAVQLVLIDANLDVRDGRGPLSCELGLSTTATSPLGARTLGVNGTCAPQASAAAERPTLKAIYDSYRINGQVVAHEFAADEGRSRAAGAAANARGAVPNELADALVKANPGRFQAVPTRNFLKAVDF